MNAKECHKEDDRKEVSQFKVFQVSTVSEYIKFYKVAGLQMSIKIKRTAVLSQSKGLPGTVIFKMTAQDFHN